MPLSLHAAFVPSALQILGTADHLVDKAESWCGETGCEHRDAIGARIHGEMLPFSYQIKSVAAHTAGAIEGVRGGVFSPEMMPPPDSFEGLRAAIAKARDMLEAVSDDEMESFIGRPMQFVMGDFRMPFTAQDFLLSFSQPNYYFHAATGYDILRMKGVKLGKRDFLGRMRLAAA